MTPEENDYEQVGRWLDGQPVDLTGRQRELVRQVLEDEAAVGAHLDVTAPRAVLNRLRGRGRRRATRLAGWIGAAAAVAAAIMLSVVLTHPASPPADLDAVADLGIFFGTGPAPDGAVEIVDADEPPSQEDQWVLHSEDPESLASLKDDQTLEAFFDAADQGGGT